VGISRSVSAAGPQRFCRQIQADYPGATVVPDPAPLNHSCVHGDFQQSSRAFYGWGATDPFLSGWDDDLGLCLSNHRRYWSHVSVQRRNVWQGFLPPANRSVGNNVLQPPSSRGTTVDARGIYGFLQGSRKPLRFAYVIGRLPYPGADLAKRSVKSWLRFDRFVSNREVPGYSTHPTLSASTLDVH